MPEDTDWLAGCKRWSGKQESLPIGYNGPLGISAVGLIKSWDVLDAKSDKGFTTKKTDELRKGDVIIRATPNDNSIALILQHHGSDAFAFTDADRNKLNAKEWFDRYHTNPFEIVAIRNKTQELLR